MTDSTKAILKNTLVGLLGGGVASAIYALNNREKAKSSDQDSVNNEITVPLSRRLFMKAVRPRTHKTEPKPDSSSKKETRTGTSVQDVSKMTPQELMLLKKSLLRSKTASAKCNKAKFITAPVSAERQVRHVAGAESTFARDDKGRFSTDKEKKAGVVDSVVNGVTGVMHGIFGDTLEDAGVTIAKKVGLVGGAAAGLAASKMIMNRILVNKKKKQVEAARKRYVDTLSAEVNDEDAPYYKKSAEDTSRMGSLLGLLGVTGLGAGTAAGIVMYRIMENRRIALEKAKDKDLAKYPIDKIVKFRFPKDPKEGSGDRNFFV